MIPLLVMVAKKPRARNAKDVTIDELFLEQPENVRHAPQAQQQKPSWFCFFHGVDNVCAPPSRFSRSAYGCARSPGPSLGRRAMNGEEGLGAIFPAMANSVMMFDVLGFPEDHPQRAIARKSVEKLLVVHDNEAYCQPCVSPIWDTGLVCHALLEVGGERVVGDVKRRPRLACAQAGARCPRRLDRAAERSSPAFEHHRVHHAAQLGNVVHDFELPFVVQFRRVLIHPRDARFPSGLPPL